MTQVRQAASTGTSEGWHWKDPVVTIRVMPTLRSGHGSLHGTVALVLLCVLSVVLAACGTTAVRPESGALGGTCAAAFRRAAQASPAVDTDLDATIRTCANLDEWTAAAEAYPGPLGGQEPVALLVARCTDPATDLGMFAVCHSLAVALATPPPTPRPTKRPRSTPMPTPRTTPRPTRAPDVAGHQRAVCAALGSIRSADHAIGTWRILPDRARELDYQLALANLFTPGSTPVERASRRAEAIRLVEEAWRRLESGFRQDATWIEAGLSDARRFTADAPYWSRGTAFKRDLIDVVGQLEGRVSSIARWFDKRKSVNIDGVFAALDRTERNLGRALRSAPFGCR